MRKKCIPIIIVGLIIAGCSKPVIEQPEVTFDPNYYPLDSGNWKIYNATQIEIDKATGVFDTINYQIKEINSGWYVDGQGDSAMIVERFQRVDESEKWLKSGVWQSKINYKNAEAIQTEENIKYLKLKFPLKIKKTWDGNAYNRLDSMNYKVTSMNISETIHNNTFDSVVTITQRDKESLVDKVYFVEKYVYGLGLVHMEKIDVYSDDNEFTIPILDRVTKGTFYYQEIKEYGTN